MARLQAAATTRQDRLPTARASRTLIRSKLLSENGQAKGIAAPCAECYSPGVFPKLDLPDDVTHAPRMPGADCHSLAGLMNAE